MTKGRLAALQSGLNAASGKRQAVAPAPANQAPADAGKANAREGQIHLGAWMAADFKKSLMLAQVKTGRKQNDLIREAFNDLFAKYDVPVIGN